jgi:hypothetical protein
MTNKAKYLGSLKDFKLKLVSILVFTLSATIATAQTTAAQQHMTFDEFINAAQEQNLDLKIESEKSKAAH